MPTSSSPTQSISAVLRRSAKPLANRSRVLLRTWPTGPRKTGTHYFASSTASSRGRKVPREALFRFSSPVRCIDHSVRSRWSVPCPGGSRAVSMAQAETLLRGPLRCPPAKECDRLFHDRASVLHPQGLVEAEVVPARLRLRPRVAGQE